MTSKPAPSSPARERLMATAERLFYDRGIRAVGVEEVAAEAATTKMSLYRHFPSKDALVAEVLRARDARYWTGWWDATVAKHPGDPRRQLEALFEEIGARTTRPGYRGCPFTNAAVEFPEPGHPGRAVAAANKRELRRRLAALAKAARARDPGLLADQLVLLAEGAYAIGQTLPDDNPARTIASAARALLAAAISPQRGQSKL